MDFTVGVNVGYDDRILIHIRIPDDEGLTITQAESLRDLLDKQITMARSLASSEENVKRYRSL